MLGLGFRVLCFMFRVWGFMVKGLVFYEVLWLGFEVVRLRV